MAKFYKPGRVVVVLNGRNAGKKGVIVKSNYENSKDKKFPHCMVVGLTKNPKRVTKNSLKRVEEKLRKFESAGNAEVVNKMKRVGVFIKTYNMSHLLVTRYKVEEDFGLVNGIDKLEKSELEIKNKQTDLQRKEAEKKEESKGDVETLKKELGGLKDRYKNSLRDVKQSIGTQLFNRYMRGFVKTRDNVEENEKITHSEFLFKKLKF